MKKKVITDDKLDQNKRLNYKYTVDFKFGFHYQELPTNAYEASRVLDQNVIVFMLEGSCSFSYDHYINRVFFAGEMLFLPKSAIASVLILENAKFLHLAFDIPISASDRQYIQQQWNIARDITYDFTPLKINYSIGVFINSLVHLIHNGGDCFELHEIKQREVFMLLRLFYTREQFSMFFHPIIGKSFNFKNFVLANYVDCYNLKELIERSNICPNVFMRKFKKEFGMSAYQWILKQMCLKIQHKASQPGITVKEIMSEVGINSYSHFNQICKRHFNLSPRQLIIQYQSEMCIK
jgi:AraC-like DNA-binding protein